VLAWLTLSQRASCGPPASLIWQVLSIGSGYHRISARHSGKDLTVASASTANGANIMQYTYGGSATNDEWQMVDAGSP